MNIDILNSREWAILVWVLIALGFIAHPSVWRVLKGNFVGLVRAFVSRHIISSITFMTIYVVMMIYGLSHLGIWNFSLLKESLIWFFSVAFFSLIQINKFVDSPNQIRDIVVDNLKLIIIVEYLVGVFTFNFAIEFILVPLVVAMSYIRAYTQSDQEQEQEQVYKFASGVLGVIGIVVVVSAVYQFSKNYNYVANRQAALEFSLPIILSALFLPFMGFMVVYCTYQRILIRLRYSITVSSTEIYARFVTMLIFNIRISLLERWFTIVAKSQLQTIGEVNQLFRLFFEMLKREKASEDIFLPEGWSPHQAKN